MEEVQTTTPEKVQTTTEMVQTTTPEKVRPFMKRLGGRISLDAEDCSESPILEMLDADAESPTMTDRDAVEISDDEVVEIQESTQEDVPGETRESMMQTAKMVVDSLEVESLHPKLSILLQKYAAES